VGWINWRAINDLMARCTVDLLQHAIDAKVCKLGYALAPAESVKLARASKTSRWAAVTSGSRHMGPIKRHVMRRSPTHNGP
jgi:hypothetical protein